MQAFCWLLSTHAAPFEEDVKCSLVKARPRIIPTQKRAANSSQIIGTVKAELRTEFPTVDEDHFDSVSRRWRRLVSSETEDVLPSQAGISDGAFKRNSSPMHDGVL